MDWDKRAKQNAEWCGFNAMSLGAVEAKGIQGVYVQAARWQRDMMRSPEVLSRVKDTLDNLDDWYGASNDEKAKAILGSIFADEA